MNHLFRFPERLATRTGHRISTIALVLPSLLLATSLACAQAVEEPVYFSHAGTLVSAHVQAAPSVESGAPTAPVLRNVRRASPPTAQVREVCGVTSSGLALALLRPLKINPGYEVVEASDLATLTPEGHVARTWARNVLRAYASPSGSQAAVISPDYRLSIVGQRTRTCSIPGRVVMAFWTPDETALVLTVYPADWSPKAVNNAPTTEEFLRLMNNDLWLLDLDTAKADRLTDHPGADYGGVLAPGGNTLLFFSEREGPLSSFLMDLPSRRVRPACPRTPEGNPALRIGRSQTYRWASSGAALIYETSEDDNAPGIRWMRPDADRPNGALLSQGSQPRILQRTQAIAWLDRAGDVQVAAFPPEAGQ